MVPTDAQHTSTSTSLDDADENEQSQIDAQIQRESTPDMPIDEDPMPRAQSWRLPPNLDPEWMAFQVFIDNQDSDSDDDESGLERPQSSRSASFQPSLANALADLAISSSPKGTPVKLQPTLTMSPEKRAGLPVKTTLSLLEMLLKLSALQQFRQESHLAIEDELLNFFLEDSGTAGAGSDKHHRQEIRHAAIQRVGFDPYDESPIKRRGEEYIRGADASPRSVSRSPAQTGLLYDEDYVLQRSSPDSSIGNSSPTHAERFSRSTQPTTPSKSSTPDLRSHAQCRAVQEKFDSEPSRASSGVFATPPSIQKTRPATLRTQSEMKARSPLRETHAPIDD